MRIYPHGVCVFMGQLEHGGMDEWMDRWMAIFTTLQSNYDIVESAPILGVSRGMPGAAGNAVPNLTG